MDLANVRFKPGQRQLSAGALNAMVDGIRELQREDGGGLPHTSGLVAVKTEAAIAVGSKGYVKRVYFEDETSDTPAQVVESGEHFYAVNLGPSPIVADEYVMCFNTAGILPVLFHTHPATFGAAYYLSGSASADVANYRLAQNTPVSTQATVTATITGAAQVIEEWVTPANEPGIVLLLAGAIDIHLYAAKTSGTKTVSLQGVMYRRTAAGVETLLGTSAASSNLGAIPTFCDLYAAVAETEFDDTDRLVLKVTATPGGAGTNPVVALYVGGDTVAQFSFEGDRVSAGGGDCAACVGDVKQAMRLDDHDNDSSSGYLWMLLNGRTIGDASSGADEDSADMQELFEFLWNNTADAQCAVSGGRGASSIADWNAHKTLTIPDMSGTEGNPVLPAAAGESSIAVAETMGNATHAHGLGSHTHSSTDHDTAHSGFTDIGSVEHPTEYSDPGTPGHDTVSVYNGEGDEVLVVDGYTADHLYGIHTHGANTDVLADEINISAASGNTDAASSYPPVLGMGFFILAYTP